MFLISGASSKPPMPTWRLGNRTLTSTNVTTRGDETLSVVMVMPTYEDHDKRLSCQADHDWANDRWVIFYNDNHNNNHMRTYVERGYCHAHLWRFWQETITSSRSRWTNVRWSDTQLQRQPRPQPQRQTHSCLKWFWSCRLIIIKNYLAIGAMIVEKYGT